MTILKNIKENGKSTLILDGRLEHFHYGEKETYQGTKHSGESADYEVELRAEVGLLTRNIVISGDDETSDRDLYGVHIFIHTSQKENSNIAPYARFSYIEITRAGQAYKISRHPIHWYLNGPVRGESYARGCAVHNSYNRAFGVQGTKKLTLENNVAYNIMGHSFFLEDGAET